MTDRTRSSAGAVAAAVAAALLGASASGLAGAPGADTAPPAASRAWPCPPRVAPDTVTEPPADSYGSPGVRRLIRRARAALDRRDTAIRRLDVTWRERVYLGVSGDRFRRERSLLRQERAARIRWTLDGDREVRWLGARSESPVGDARVDFTEDFDFVDPSSDSLYMGSGWGLHPLGDSAAHHYRYRSGDTLRIETAGRSAVLAEVRVQPRKARFDRVAGSFWFDTASGALVRAAYRPARTFDLEEDDPEDAADVPGIFRPVRVGVDYIVADYGLHELRWWLPNRMAFRGRLGIGESVAFPFQAEWSFDAYRVNGEEPVVSPGTAPEGWRRIVRTRDADSIRVVVTEGTDTARVEAHEVGPDPAEWERMVVLVPPEDSLRSSPELPAPIGRGADAFGAEELARLRERIDRIQVPSSGLPGPSLGWGSGMLRYNRVEALSVGAEARLPVGPATRLEAGARLGVGDLEPNGALRLRRTGRDGGYTVSLYRRLQPAGDWGAPLGTGNSLNTLLLGYDDGVYYRATGAEMSLHGRMGALRLEGALFGERHRSARKETDVSLPGLFGHDLRPNITAREGDVAGFRGELRLQGGGDPAEVGLSGRLWGEAAAGDFDYGRGAASVALATPPEDDWRGALELLAGTTTGTPPPQRNWFLGGSYSLRGYPAGTLEGGAFWAARAEASRRLGVVEDPRPGSSDRLLRAVFFLDAGWAGSRGAFGEGDPSLGIGAGLSVVDGLFRVDVARGVSGGGTWRLHLYSDGLL